MSSTDRAFLSKLNTSRISRAERVRLIEMMAEAVLEDGDEATATRLLADAETVRAGKSLRRRSSRSF